MSKRPPRGNSTFGVFSFPCRRKTGTEADDERRQATLVSVTRFSARGILLLELALLG